MASNNAGMLPGAAHPGANAATTPAPQDATAPVPQDAATPVSQDAATRVSHDATALCESDEESQTDFEDPPELRKASALSSYFQAFGSRLLSFSWGRKRKATDPPAPNASRLTKARRSKEPDFPVTATVPAPAATLRTVERDHVKPPAKQPAKLHQRKIPVAQLLASNRARAATPPERKDRKPAAKPTATPPERKDRKPAAKPTATPPEHDDRKPAAKPPANVPEEATAPRRTVPKRECYYEILDNDYNNAFTGNAFADDIARMKRIIYAAEDLVVPERIQRFCFLNRGDETGNGKCVMLRATQRHQKFLMRVIVIANVMTLIPNETKFHAQLGTKKTLTQVRDALQAASDTLFASGNDDWALEFQRVSTVMTHNFKWVRKFLRVRSSSNVTWAQVSNTGFGNAVKGLRASVSTNGTLWSMKYMLSEQVQANLELQVAPNCDPLALTGYCYEWALLFDLMVSGFRDQSLAGQPWSRTLLLDSEKDAKFSNNIGYRWYEEATEEAPSFNEEVTDVASGSDEEGHSGEEGE